MMQIAEGHGEDEEEGEVARSGQPEGKHEDEIENDDTRADQYDPRDEALMFLPAFFAVEQEAHADYRGDRRYIKHYPQGAGDGGGELRYEESQ